MKLLITVILMMQVKSSTGTSLLLSPIDKKSGTEMHVEMCIVTR